MPNSTLLTHSRPDLRYAFQSVNRETELGKEQFSLGQSAEWILEFVRGCVGTLMSVFLGVLYLLNPLWVSFLALILMVWLLSLTGLWARYRYWFLGALLALYAIDSGFALPRVLFSYGLSSHLVVERKVPLPRQLVLVGMPCRTKCHEFLMSGAIEEVVVVHAVQEERPQAIRYRAGWSNPGECGNERQRATDYSSSLLKTGYCPLIDPVETPSQGIFLILEQMTVSASQPARNFTPTYLTKRLPGSVIEFRALEVQERTPTGVAVLASTYKYVAPGFVGLPPLVGCWERFDNVIGIMPPGDTGCGFWRWFTWGGDNAFFGFVERNWSYEDVFAPPDRTMDSP